MKCLPCAGIYCNAQSGYFHAILHEEPRRPRVSTLRFRAIWKRSCWKAMLEEPVGTVCDGG